MSLDSWTALKASIADWLNRADLSAVIPDFITLAEAQLNRKLRTRDMIERSTATIDAEFVALPGDFLAPRTITLDASPPLSLRYVSPDELNRMTSLTTTETGAPRVYTVVDGSFQFFPAPDAQYDAELSYWKKISALSADNASNWLLVRHPDAYLYGALLQAAPYLIDDARISSWGALYQTVLADIEREDINDAMAGDFAMPDRVVV